MCIRDRFNTFISAIVTCDSIAAVDSCKLVVFMLRASTSFSTEILILVLFLVVAPLVVVPKSCAVGVVGFGAVGANGFEGSTAAPFPVPFFNFNCSSAMLKIAFFLCLCSSKKSKLSSLNFFRMLP